MTRLRFVGRPARGEVETPGGKSHAIRAAFLAAQASGRSILRGCPRADDLDRALAWLRAGGVRAAREGGDVTIDGLGGAPRFGERGDARFDAGEAAAVLRLGLFWLAAGEGRAEIGGSPRLAERPIAEGLHLLRALGAAVEGERLPLALHAHGIDGGAIEAAPDATSQFVSGCLLAAPSFRGPLALALPAAPIPSEAFLARTLAAMRAFGVDVKESSSGGRRTLEVRPGAPRATDVRVEPDASTRLVLACAAAVLGGATRLRDGAGVDSGLAALRDAGARVTEEPGAVRVEGPLTRPIAFDADADPDLVPPLVAAALFAPGASRFRRVARLRGKESDRVRALIELAAAVGGDARLEAEMGGETFVVSAPRRLRAAPVSAHGDHRIAMAAALVALAVEGIELDDPACVAKSAGDFFERLDAAIG